MSLSARLVALRDRALLTGVVGGTIISISGTLGYIVVPAWTADRDFVVAAMGSVFSVTSLPASYHLLVLVLPAVLASLLGTLLLRRWGLRGRSADLKLLGGIVGTPLVVIFFLYVVAAVGFGVGLYLGDLLEQPLRSLSGMLIFAGLALSFGLIALSLLLPVVVSGIGLSTAGGYLLARGILYAADSVR
ncbi:hypothetical protein AUR64_10880 [Haloprofundus marisrubri]|uniref:Uncharacterized protein n=1 Tax=Haloprofundus marisrubri TaxID=1514971 RepID=A0A0W1R9C0_9EURY|nr:hypothetical protein [Haloprofundus marisrubri]KTG10092.1 hypothetical protein AUR64_10880 [Haloprofundus marisrubri]